jgi:hypothetical protein
MNKFVDIKTNGGYTLEQIKNNKNCSKDMKYWYNIEGTDRYLFKSKCAESWEFYDPLIDNPIKNTNQVYIKFLDVSKFVEPSNYFREYSCYTHELEGTISGESFWDDMEDKITNGFEYEGVRITGRHFFTINFGRFRAVPVDEHGKATSINKIWTFLRFLDHQYYVFHELEECLLDGIFKDKVKYLKWFSDKLEEDFSNLKMENFVGAKSRRKGWSAIEGIGLVAYNFIFKESSMNMIAAYEKTHYKPILAATRSTKTFVDKYTPWVRVTGIKGTSTHFIAGIKTTDEFGVPIEEGYLSEVSATSFQDNSFKGIGECFSPNQLVINYLGEKVEIGSLKVNDLLLGPDGTLRKVLNVHTGTDLMTTYSQNKGVDFTVNTEHLIHGKYIGNSNQKILNIKSKDFLNKSNSFKRYFRTLKSEGFDFGLDTYDVDGYLYGLWLGDGDSRRLAIASMDIEIEEYLKELCTNNNLKLDKRKISDKNKAFHYRLTGLKGNYKTIYIYENGNAKIIKGLEEFVKLYGLSKPSWQYILTNLDTERSKKALTSRNIEIVKIENTHGSDILNWFYNKNLIKNKHITKDLIYQPRETRLRFLAGFIDTDGSINTEKKIYTISQKDRKLLEDTATIARSLGFYASVNTFKRTSGLGKILNDYSKLTISGDIWNIPVKIERKKTVEFKHHVPVLESSITKVNQYVGEYVGIEVDKDHLFLLEDFTIVHNSADLIIVEEPGKFNTLEETYPVSIEPLIRDGENRIGVCIMAGTAGDLEGGGSVALSKVIYHPSSYGFKEYDNIYEDKWNNEKSGWFIDDLWYLPFKLSKIELLKMDSSDRTKQLLDNIKGNYVETVDDLGNSYRYFANIILENKRKSKKETDIKSYNKFITQQPKYLSEAFLLNESSPFDTATAQLVLGELRVHYDKIQKEKGSFGIDETGKPNWILNFSLQHIDNFPFDTSSANSDGCWVIYERPVKTLMDTSYWRYVAGNDPLDMGRDESADSKRHSLSVTYIIDVITRNIVAEYVGRPSTAEQYWEQLWRGIEYYGARLLYENNLKGLKGHFEKRHKMYLLADEPESLRNTSGYKMNKNATKGFHATPQSNALARKYIDSWTKEEMFMGQDDEGNNIFIPRMYSIKSIGLLEEILAWNSKGNFDRISGLGATMILLFDRLYEVQEDESTTDMFNEGIFKKMNKQLKTKNRFNTKEYATK